MSQTLFCEQKKRVNHRVFDGWAVEEEEGRAVVAGGALSLDVCLIMETNGAIATSVTHQEKTEIATLGPLLHSWYTNNHSNSKTPKITTTNESRGGTWTLCGRFTGLHRICIILPNKLSTNPFLHYFLS